MLEKIGGSYRRAEPPATRRALVRGVFAAAVNAAPQRAAFVAAIAPSGASDAEAMRTVSKMLPDFSRPLDALGKYLRDRHLES